MATSRFAKVTASSLLVLVASTSASLILFLKKDDVHISPQLDYNSASSNSRSGSFIRETSQVPSIKTQSDVVSLLSSSVRLLRRSSLSLLATSSDNQYRQSSSLHFNVPDLVKSLRDRFRVGDYYIWIYRDANNHPSSWEKYTITNVCDDGVVVINMSTKFSDAEKFVTHHRMTVNLGDNLKAVDGKDSWRLCGFEYRDCEVEDDGGIVVNWKQLGIGDNVQAFEEKFDIFNMIRPPPSETTDGDETRMVKMNRDVTALVRTNRHGYTQAWYAPPEHGVLSGVAVVKDFKEHSFCLIESGRDSVVQWDVNLDIK